MSLVRHGSYLEHGFRVLPRRRVVERTFSWLGNYRRFSRDYERQAHRGGARIYVATMRLLLARLARQQ